MTTGFYSFVAIKGKWGSSEYYIIQCPLRTAARIFSFADSDVPEQLREIQTLDTGLLKTIDRRLRLKTDEYILNALVVVMDGQIEFEPIQPPLSDLGMLRIPLEAVLLICAGQEQQAAIGELLHEGVIMPDDTIPVVLIPDSDSVRATTIYLQLNQGEGNRSQRVLTDANDLNHLVLELADSVPVFQGRTEKTKTTISNRSTALFTLSAVHQATQALAGIKDDEALTEQKEKLAHEYWTALGKTIPEWSSIIRGEVTASYLRENYIHAHTVSLLALGITGNALIEQYSDDWQGRLNKLGDIDWSRRNIALWEGRAMVRGRMSKARDSVTLTVNVLKRALGLPLTEKENELEQWIDG